ncbi:MAG: hypothetical protein E7319_08080 [Clostridiales bacterium]|nr:hypothetical protein [Clostridiales bacterium]
MYTREEQAVVAAKCRKRMLVTFIPAAIVLAAAIALFVWGQINRYDETWKITAALTILGGGYAIFMYGVYVKPMRNYRNHVNYMLDGRVRETAGVFKAFSDDVMEKHGVQCHPLMINVGEKDDGEDDRLFYYDVLKPAPEMPLGTRVVISSNDMMVAEIREE